MTLSLTSHPSRVRELKHERTDNELTYNMSHPSRVRELKRIGRERVAEHTDVAPLPGA